jgi:hypothetical protein
VRRALHAIVTLVPALIAAGCYASHEPRPFAGELCGPPPTDVGETCATSIHALPRGVCALADGSLLAFSDGAVPVGCGRERADGPLLFTPYRCSGPGPRRRAVVSCGDVPERIITFQSDSRTERYDLTRTSCALTDVHDPTPAEPWRPFVEATELCSDPYAWCGSPLVLELRVPSGDTCSGRSHAHRCAVRIDDRGRIVLRAETARAAPEICEPAFGDRAVSCIVPPRSAGTHEVVDESGRALGTILIPAEQPTGDLEPACAPF